MGFVQLALCVYHLGLDPYAKVKSGGVYFFTQAFESSGQLLRVFFPVSQGACIVVALREPAVVHNEKLYAEPLGCFCHSRKASLGDVEVTRFPAV